jgi:hypothetical protein
MDTAHLLGGHLNSAKSASFRVFRVFCGSKCSFQVEWFGQSHEPTREERQAQPGDGICPFGGSRAF